MSRSEWHAKWQSVALVCVGAALLALSIVALCS